VNYKQVNHRETNSSITMFQASAPQCAQVSRAAERISVGEPTRY
jgi:hypothetical protein